MATVYMLYGLVGSGKTTYARVLEQRGAVRISIDEWTIAASGDRVHLDPALFERIWRQLLRHWPAIAAHGVDVVLDLGFFTRRQRDEARALAASVGARARLVWVQCAAGVAQRRCAERPPDPTGYWIDGSAFASIAARLEPLGADEPHEIVKTD